MEYHHKESTHNKKKIITGCNLCWENTINCKACNGVCIFSLAFFKSCEYNKKFRKSLQAKRFKEDFDMVRGRLVETGEYDEYVQADDEYEVLKAFHESDEQKISNIWKKHNPCDIGLMTRPNRVGVLMSNHSVKGRCHEHRSIADKRPHHGYDFLLPKTHKKQENMRSGGDFTLKIAEKKKEENFCDIYKDLLNEKKIHVNVDV